MQKGTRSTARIRAGSACVTRRAPEPLNESGVFHNRVPAGHCPSRKCSSKFPPCNYASAEMLALFCGMAISFLSNDYPRVTLNVLRSQMHKTDKTWFDALKLCIYCVFTYLQTIYGPVKGTKGHLGIGGKCNCASQSTPRQIRNMSENRGMHA